LNPSSEWLRWAGAATKGQAEKRTDANGFRRLKAHKQLPLLREALQEQNASDTAVAPDAAAA